MGRKAVELMAPGCPHCGEPGGGIPIQANRRVVFRSVVTCGRCQGVFYTTLTHGGQFLSTTTRPGGWDLPCPGPPYPLEWSGKARMLSLTLPFTEWSETERAAPQFPVAACNCPECGALLTRLSWSRSVPAGDPPLAGVVVRDTRVHGVNLARLDNRLRDQRLAAAVLLCGRCRAETAFVLRGSRIASRVGLTVLVASLALPGA